MIESYIEVNGRYVTFMGSDALTQDSWVKLVARRKGHIRNGDVFECKEGHEVVALAALAKVPVYTKMNDIWYLGAKEFSNVAKDHEFLLTLPQEEMEFVLLNCKTFEKMNREAMRIHVLKNYEFSTNFLLEMYRKQTVNVNSYNWGGILFKRKDIPEEVLKEFIVDRKHVVFISLERNLIHSPFPQSVIDLGMNCSDNIVRIRLAKCAPVSQEQLEKLLSEAMDEDSPITPFQYEQLTEKLASMKRNCASDA